MEYVIRPIRENEYPLLEEFLYLAIFVPKGATPPPKSIVKRAELQVYVERFGESKDDLALVAQVGDKVVGVVWSRIMNDYGHIDDDTPSLAISVQEEYRNKGIGTQLLKDMLLELKRGYKQASLSVQKANYAARLYIRSGFDIVEENEEEYKMVCIL